MCAFTLQIAVAVACLVAMAHAQYHHIAEDNHLPVDHHIAEYHHVSPSILRI
jgi:hypothetical protein